MEGVEQEDAALVENGIHACRRRRLADAVRDRAEPGTRRDADNHRAGAGLSRSQVYSVAHRFLEQGAEGLVDGRTDNGEAKVSADYIGCVLAVVAGAPTQHGYDRPTWTQELLILVCARKTGIAISTTTMSRLLGAEGVRHGRPKPTVACPCAKPEKRGG